MVVVISEERGEVSIASNKKISHMENPQSLSEFITEAIRPYSPQRITWQERLRSFFTKQWQVKLGTLFLVSMLWLLLAGQQDFETNISVPLEIKNLPPTIQILEPLNPRVKIRVRGLRKDASILSEKNVLAQIDLSSAHPGKTTFAISREHIRLPNERIYVVNIEPHQMEFKFK